MIPLSQAAKGAILASILALVFCVSAFHWVQVESSSWDVSPTSWNPQRHSRFASIIETKPVRSVYKRSSVVTYRVTDEKGELVDITEEVSASAYKKYRVGDTIPVYSRTEVLFGRPRTVARIQENSFPPRNLGFLKGFFFWGGICSLVQLGLILFFFRWGFPSWER